MNVDPSVWVVFGTSIVGWAATAGIVYYKTNENSKKLDSLFVRMQKVESFINYQEGWDDALEQVGEGPGNPES